MEENQLRNLREQANRTGDREGFALDIIHVEEQIRSLQQDNVRAENEQRDARNNVNQLTRKSQISVAETTHKKARSI
ncbi:MAG: hypothetical protein GKR97_18740 [Rhizobiaceae bacterium]|nr:hypothetical protein [Rhizobiaceae bacterium]